VVGAVDVVGVEVPLLVVVPDAVVVRTVCSVVVGVAAGER
jgi:hypothetical protein